MHATVKKKKVEPQSKEYLVLLRKLHMNISIKYTVDDILFVIDKKFTIS